MKMGLTVWALLCVTCTAQAFFLSSQAKGAMLPLNPFAAANESLQVNCSITSPTACDSVHSLYFQWGSWKINDSFTRVVNSNTKDLNLPNPPMNYSGVHLYCYCLKDSKKVHLTHQTVRVFRYPIKPVITGCKVFNWEKMECYWEPSDKVQDNHTGLNVEQTMYWTLLPHSRNKYKCPHRNLTSCTWKQFDDPNSYRPSFTYYLQVEVANTYATVSSKARFDTSEAGTTCACGLFYYSLQPLKL